MRKKQLQWDSISKANQHGAAGHWNRITMAVMLSDVNRLLARWTNALAACPATASGGGDVVKR